MATLSQRVHISWNALSAAWRARATAETPRSSVFSTGAMQVYSVGAIAYLYFLGWMYLYYYLFEFGIDIFSLEIPLHYFIVYAFATVTFVWSEYPWILLLVGVLIPAAMAACQILLTLAGESRLPPWVGFLAGSVTAVLIGLVFFLGHSVAHQAGLWNYKRVRFAPPTFYEFTFKQTAPSGDTFLDVIQTPSFVANQQIVPIIETKDRYFVLVQIVDVEKPATRGVSRVVEVNRENVLFARVNVPEVSLTPEEQDKVGR